MRPQPAVNATNMVSEKASPSPPSRKPVVPANQKGVERMMAEYLQVIITAKAAFPSKD